MNTASPDRASASRKPSLPLSRGLIARPQKAVLYGPEGVGKTTLASHLPSPIFLDTEGGTHHLDVTRFAGIESWEAITGAVAQLAAGGHDFRTLVLDTVDWAEKRLAEHLCRKASKDSIEDFGYGKGYVLLAEEFAKFLASLDGLLARGMHVVFLAHSTVKKFESPDQAGSYDRYELKLTKQVAPLVREWADAILFANFVTHLAEKDNGRLRGVGGKERVLFTSHTAAYDAKNRHGLPDKLPFQVEALQPVFGSCAALPKEQSAPARSAPEQTSLEEQLKRLVPPTERKDTIEFLVSRGQLKAGQGFADLSEDYAWRVLAEPERFLEAVRTWVNDQIPGINATPTAEEAAAKA